LWAASCCWLWEAKRADRRRNVSTTPAEGAIMDKRKKMLDAQLEEWNAQIALLKARAKKARAEAKIEY
jgi:hypothetical protein